MDDAGSPLPAEVSNSVLIQISFRNTVVIHMKTSRLELGKTATPKPGHSLNGADERSSKRQRLRNVVLGQPTDTLPDVVEKAEENIVLLIVSVHWLELPDKAPADFSVLIDKVDRLCCLHSMDFGDLVEEHEWSFVESSPEAVSFLLVDPPFNIRRCRADGNMDQSKFTADDVRRAVHSSWKSLILAPTVTYFTALCTLDNVLQRRRRLLTSWRTVMILGTKEKVPISLVEWLFSGYSLFLCSKPRLW